MNKRIDKFNFGKDTASVFDDMLNRSVPLYHELQRMIGEIAKEFAQDKTNVYDLGCSTGITMCTLLKNIDKKVKFVGIDYSMHMLDKCREKLAINNSSNCPLLICADLNQEINITNASVVVLNLTLQFLNPLYRDKLIKSVYEGLVGGGCLIFVEKVLGNGRLFNEMFIKFYYDMKKRRGYSKLEIAKKREALDNILIPFSLDKNKQLLVRNGFVSSDIFFKWYNFCGLIAVK